MDLKLPVSRNSACSYCQGDLQFTLLRVGVGRGDFLQVLALVVPHHTLVSYVLARGGCCGLLHLEGFDFFIFISNRPLILQATSNIDHKNH